MTLAYDLLKQAEELADNEPRRPKQASLRRAVSTAYYALFHLLIDDAASALSPPAPAALQKVVRRAFQHGAMKSACKDFFHANSVKLKKQKSILPPAVDAMLVFPLEAELVIVLTTFVDLQEARHKADYDFADSWSRHEARNNIRAAREAFVAWSKIRKSPNAAVFMTALLIRKDWGR